MIPPGMDAALHIPGVQVLQLGKEDCCMQLIKPAVDAVEFCMVAAALAVLPEHPDALSYIPIIGDHHAPIPIGAEVLGGIKGEAAGAAYRHPLSPVGCAMRLAAVLDYFQVMLLCNLLDGLHI